MATLEDKILGEKLEYYCSSDSETEDNANGSNRDGPPTGDCEPPPLCSGESKTHTSRNTGPKGVVEDWERFKALQALRRAETERQRIEIAKKASMTTATPQEEDERKQQEDLDAELDELLSEDFLQQYQKQRMAEMMRQCGNSKQFGKVETLTTHDDFLNSIEKENKNTIVIIHIYDSGIAACSTLNKNLDTLAAEYPNVKFAKICCSVAGMSRDFRTKGLPALLVYKNKEIIGNFVRLVDDLGDEFYPSDVENFLIEHDILVDRNLLLSSQ